MSYAPIFEAVAGEVGPGILMASVDVSENPQSPAPFGIEGIPATIFLENGKEVHRLEGQVTKEELLAAIAQVFPQSGAPATPGAQPPAGAPAKIPTAALVVGGVAVAGILTYLLLR